MRTIVLAAMCAAACLCPAQAGVIQDDSHHKKELEEFLEAKNLMPVTVNAVAYSGNLFLFFSSGMTNVASQMSCDLQREFVFKLFLGWEQAIKPELATGVIIRSYTGRDLMIYKRGVFSDTYHCE